MIVRANHFTWQYDCKFTMSDCDALGNVFQSSVFRVTELAREEFFHERVEGYSDLLKNGLEVMAADAQFEFHARLLPFDRVACLVTVTEVNETAVVIRFHFRHHRSDRTCAESTQFIRFATANHKIYVPGNVRRAMNSLLVIPASASESSRSLVSASQFGIDYYS
jgi:acyl-CoA thioesterase FadM